MKKYFAEGIGTCTLVFLGTLAAVESQGNVIITSLVFGLTLTVLVAVFGSLSGSHVNPAVSFGAWISGNLSTSDIVPYWIAQFLGATGASVALRLFLGVGSSLGETTFTALSPSNALILEGVCTFVFVFVVLSARSLQGRLVPALLVGGALFILHLIALPFTGAGLNPARSIAPVVVSANAQAAAQLWVYVLGPFIGAGAAGIALRLMDQKKT